MNTILEQIKLRLRQFHKDEEGNIVFDNVEEDIILHQLIVQATKDVRDYRNYPPSFTKEKIEQDIKQYESVIVNLVIYDYSHEGIEFETSHTEPGVTRSYVSRDSILSKVVPFVHFIN